MPGGDGTGPLGTGPRGWYGRGGCRGWRPGWGAGRGGGWGARYGWQRGGWWGREPIGWRPEDEERELRYQVELLERELDDARRRLTSLERAPTAPVDE